MFTNGKAKKPWGIVCFYINMYTPVYKVYLFVLFLLLLFYMHSNVSVYDVFWLLIKEGEKELNVLIVHPSVR